MTDLTETSRLVAAWRSSSILGSLAGLEDRVATARRGSALLTYRPEARPVTTSRVLSVVRSTADRLVVSARADPGPGPGRAVGWAMVTFGTVATLAWWTAGLPWPVGAAGAAGLVFGALLGSIPDLDAAVEDSRLLGGTRADDREADPMG